MRIRDFLDDPQWDAPFFKRLSHNDTGKAAGHQGGIVITKDLRRFFPTLDEDDTSPANPTTGRAIHARLYLGTLHLDDVETRYQFQTWTGTRSPESRLTGNLGPLRNRADRNDPLVIQRSRDALDQFRLMLINQGTPDYAAIVELFADRPSGPLSDTTLPVTQTELQTVATEVQQTADQPFTVTKPEVTRTETKHKRIVRDIVFSETVRAEYGEQCCVSGTRLGTPGGLYEIEAAHIVPVGDGGTDDPRNGLALARTLHWAFDRGLFGILPDRTIYLPRQVQEMPDPFLRQFAGKKIREAKTKQYHAHKTALAWHFDHYVKRWE